MPAISVHHLCKEYVIDGPQPGGVNFREALMQTVGAPFRKLFGTVGGADTSKRTLLALQDVSFEVARGEVIGIIGPNGAGKSTLLKILSRVTEPTRGSVRFRGRVSSLLEVGTGFHPELTGRENVYVNGAILGMTKTQIRKKFDEIVDFSGVEDFIDTPVKRYSSGMRVRLAYSVSAQLDPDIFLIDEALGVGDMEFREKCLRHLQVLTRSGRTVVLVSHDLQTLTNSAKRLLLIMDGRLIKDGESGAVMDHYAGLMEEKKLLEKNDKKESRPEGVASEGAPSFSHLGTVIDESSLGESSLRFVVNIECGKPWHDVGMTVIINNAGGQRVLASVGALGDVNAGNHQLRIELKDHRLSPAYYSLDFVFYTKDAWRAFTHVTKIQIPRTERTANARGGGVVLGELGISFQN